MTDLLVEIALNQKKLEGITLQAFLQSINS